MCSDCKEENSKQAQLLFMLKAVERQIICMNPSEFNEKFKNNSIEFTRYGFGQKVKTNVKISMLDMDESQ